MNSEKLSARDWSRSVALCALLGAFLLGAAGLLIPSSALAGKPVCGDGTCQGKENAVTCSADCDPGGGGEPPEPLTCAEFGVDLNDPSDPGAYCDCDFTLDSASTGDTYFLTDECSTNRMLVIPGEVGDRAVSLIGNGHTLTASTSFEGNALITNNPPKGGGVGNIILDIDVPNLPDSNCDGFGTLESAIYFNVERGSSTIGCCSGSVQVTINPTSTLCTVIEIDSERDVWVSRADIGLGTYKETGILVTGPDVRIGGNNIVRPGALGSVAVQIIAGPDSFDGMTDDAVISGNELVSDNVSLWIDGSDGSAEFSEVKVNKNTILDAETGILLEDTAAAVISKNVIAHDSGTPGPAILCEDSSATVRGNNTITGYGSHTNCP